MHHTCKYTCKNAKVSLLLECMIAVLVFNDFGHGFAVFGTFCCGFAVFATPKCPPLFATYKSQGPFTLIKNG